MKAPTPAAVLWKEDHPCVAACPEVGTASQGESIDEALANLKEAAELYVEELPPARQSDSSRAQ